jgi:hypothetical protein
MDITKCRPAPEESWKKSKIIIQLIGNAGKHTTENKKQNPVQ